jgi:hypothetical protein
VKLATSRYGAADLIAESGLAPVGVTVSLPRWRLPYELAGVASPLAPNGLLELDDEIVFEARYRERLDRFGVARARTLFDAFASVADAPGCVLLCFERPGEFCHRRVFAAWWEELTGEAVPELEPAQLAFRQPVIG